MPFCFALGIAARPESLQSAPIAAGAAAGALGAAGIMLVAGAPVAWLWLWVCAAATVPVLIWFAFNGRLFEPLPVVMTVCALIFVARPLQLFLGSEDLQSYLVPQDSIQSIILLEAQEVALYVTTRLDEPLGTAFARAQGVCALFVVCLLVGYRLGAIRRLQRRLSRLGDGMRRFNELAAIALSLGIGLAAQIAIVARAGGPAAALESAAEQRAASDSFVLFLAAGFSTAAVVVWVAWRRPAGRAEQIALGVTVATVLAFWVLIGTRARVLVTLLALGIVVHYLWRRWRARELVVCTLLLLAFASSFLVLRTVARDEPLGTAASEAAHHVLDERVILNDLTAYDAVLFATTIYGETRPHEKGGFLLDAVRSYVPARVDPGKPEGGDILFRQAVWGEMFPAGRPPTAAGDFYIDFGFPGVAVGAALIGVLCRLLISLLAGEGPGRRYRVALFALALVVLYEFVLGTLSIAIGFALTLVVPFLVAVHVFGRLPHRLGVAAETGA